MSNETTHPGTDSDASDDGVVSAGADTAVADDIEADELGEVEPEPGPPTGVFAERNLNLVAGFDLLAGARGNVQVEADGDIEIESGGEIELDAADDIELEAGETIELEAGENIELQAGKDIDLEAVEEIDLAAGHEIEIESGGNIEIEAETEIEIEAGGEISVLSGAAVSVAGQTIELAADGKGHGTRVSLSHDGLRIETVRRTVSSSKSEDGAESEVTEETFVASALLMRSPNGSLFRLAVGDDGQLATSPVSKESHES